MASGDTLSPPGSSSYSSSIFHAGDGTWDSSRDTFLLPNVMGLPFDLMRYNGMGNRFAALPEYHHIILGHGILAAITFLFIVPSAILTARFYHLDSHVALRTHIALQTLTVILTTIIFVLGYFAVGPARSLSNPHHVIGLVIYLLILVQAIGGWILKKIEKGKTPNHLPMKAMLHQWIGRGTALLALAQIPIGLTLYGSPAALFALYTLVVAAWIIAYFILTYQTYKRRALQYSQDGSYISGVTGTSISHHPNRHKLEAAAGVLGLGAAIAAIRRRSSGKKHERTDSQSGMLHSEGSEYDDKYNTGRFSDNTQDEPKDHTWRNRLLAATAGIGGIAALRSFLNRGRDDEQRRHSESEVSYGRPPLGGSVGTSDMGRIEEGRPPNAGPEQDHWDRVERMEAAQANGGRRPGMPHSEYSYFSEEEESRKGLSKYLPGALGGVLAAGGISKYLERRRSKKEERTNAQNYAEPQSGQGQSPYGPPQSPYADTPPRRQRRHSYSPTTEVTENTNYNRFPGAPPPVMAGALAVAGQQRQTSHGSVMAEPHPPPSNIPPPPQTVAMGPPPPSHSGDPFTNSSSDGYGASPGAGRRPRRYSDRSGTIVSGPLGGPGAMGGHSFGDSSGILSPPPPINPNYRTSSGSPNRGNVASPPVSVNVKFSNDGRHVTLRRLNEEEAARKRAQQAQGQQSPLQPPNRRTEPYGSASPVNSQGSGGPGRYQGASPGPSRLNPQSSFQQPPQPQSNLSPSPGAVGMGSSSPAQVAGSGVSSQAYDENRRRRRAERARAEQARQQRRNGGQNRVDFQ